MTDYSVEGSEDPDDPRQRRRPIQRQMGPEQDDIDRMATQLEGATPEEQEHVLREVAKPGTDRSLYIAQALSRALKVRSPFNRQFTGPPRQSPDANIDPQGRLRPFDRSDDYTGFTGGPHDPHRNHPSRRR